MRGGKEEDTWYNKAAEKCTFFYCSINSAWINSNNSCVYSDCKSSDVQNKWIQVELLSLHSEDIIHVDWVMMCLGFLIQRPHYFWPHVINIKVKILKCVCNWCDSHSFSDILIHGIAPYDKVYDPIKHTYLQWVEGVLVGHCSWPTLGSVECNRWADTTSSTLCSTGAVQKVLH